MVEVGRERYGRIVIDRSDESSKLEKSSRIKSVKEVKLRSSRKLKGHVRLWLFTFTLERVQPYGRNSSSIFRVRVTRITLTQPYEAFSHRGEFVESLGWLRWILLCELTHAYAYLCKFGGQFIY